MNEENNQNTPILGVNEGGGGIKPTLIMAPGTYKIKFTDEYYQALRYLDGKLIEGRIMLIQNDDTNNGNYFVNKYIIYDDIFIDEYVSHFDTEHLMPGLDDNFVTEHTASYIGFIPDYRFVKGKFESTTEYHFILDEEWYNKHYGDNSNKVLRTLATGQSDITRHEAYTKAQGLNWANASVPKYSTQITYEYVDLGLPSGTLWAKMNVGATSETDYGLYFAWGETQGYADASTKTFSWSDYKYGTSSSNLTKYNGTDGKTLLDAEDDAAHINMGGNWHMPTKAQYEELLNTTYVTNTWVTDYQGSGINGRLFTSVSNGNTLFIPAAGYCSDEVNNVSKNGNIWSSSVATDGSAGYTWYLDFGNSEATVDIESRCSGQSVRGVIGGSEGPLK